MTDEWFSEYVYEVVVDRKHVPEEVLAVLEQEPIVLPAWDPMGALAEWCCLQLFPPSMEPDVAAKDRSRDWSQSYARDYVLPQDAVRFPVSTRNLFGKCGLCWNRILLKKKRRGKDQVILSTLLISNSSGSLSILIRCNCLSLTVKKFGSVSVF